LNPPEYGEEDGMTTVAENRPEGRIMTAEPGSWWLVVLGGLTGQAARVAEADRERAALLATVSHDLRAPLAAAKMAVSGLRADYARLTTDDRADLLAAAEESLDRLAHLAAGLLDVSRLQAGARAVFPRPTHVGEIVAAALDALGPQPKPVLADIPSGLPEVMADPPIAERVIVNLTGNALRYSPAAAPPLLTAPNRWRPDRAARGRSRAGHPGGRPEAGVPALPPARRPGRQYRRRTRPRGSPRPGRDDGRHRGT
jgi:signal transduction histidine kinase